MSNDGVFLNFFGLIGSKLNRRRLNLAHFSGLIEPSERQKKMEG